MITVVISDLHISAGPLDDCDAELERGLVCFISELSSRGEPVELVINGDFIDFAQAPPYEGIELESETDTGVPLCLRSAIAGEARCRFEGTRPGFQIARRVS